MKLTDEQITQLHECIGALNDNHLSDTQTEWLNALLDESEEARKVYVRTMQLCANLNWDFGTVPGDVDYPKEKLILGEPPKAELLKTTSSKRSKKRKVKTFSGSSKKLKVALWVVLPLLVLGLFWGGLHLIQSSRSPKHQAVAVVITVSDGELVTAGKLCMVNDYLKTGQQYQLSDGILQLKMDSGAEVLISGPTTFQLLGSNTFCLLQGTITANVPQNAIGFEVHAPTLKVVDLGTRFGVHVDKDGVSETHIFQGEVNCFGVQNGKDYSSPKRLAAGQTAKRTNAGKIIQSNLKSETLFASYFYHQAGIKNLSGNLKFVSKIPVKLGVCEFTSSNIHVFLEKQDFVLSEDITCSVPVQNRKGEIDEKQFTSGIIKKETKVNIYYIHFDAHCPGHVEYSAKPKHIFAVGKINFNNQVLGVFQTKTQLRRTDSSLGNSKTQYVSDRVAQSDVNRGTEDDDTTKLLPDNCGLNLNWRVGRSGLIGADCMRVIVAVPE